MANINNNETKVNYFLKNSLLYFLKKISLRYNRLPNFISIFAAAFIKILCNAKDEDSFWDKETVQSDRVREVEKKKNR